MTFTARRISGVGFTPATADEARQGLLGYFTLTFTDMVFDGVTLHAAEQHTLRFPCRTDSGEAPHAAPTVTLMTHWVDSTNAAVCMQGWSEVRARCDLLRALRLTWIQRDRLWKLGLKMQYTNDAAFVTCEECTERARTVGKLPRVDASPPGSQLGDQGNQGGTSG